MSAAPIPTLEHERSSSSSRLRQLAERFLQPNLLIRTVLYLTGLVYLRTIPFDYVFDDCTLITIHPWMESWKYLPKFFTHSFWGFLDVPRAIDFYRPLIMVVFAMIYHVLGPAPGWFHLVAASMHVLATYLVYRLACETTGDKTLGAVAAGIFGLHPTKVETAAWISGLSDSLSLVFFLAAMIEYFKWRRQPTQKRRLLLLSASLLLLALFSKEAAIFAPVLIGIYEFAAASGSFRPRLRAAMTSAWPYAAVTLFAIVIRILLVRNPTGHVLNKLPIGSTLFTAPMAILWYLGKQLWPGSLSIYYPMMIVDHLSFGRFVLPLLLLFVIVAGVVVAIRKTPVGIFFASWLVFMLAPVILYHVTLQEHDRYFYFASVATSIGVAYLIQRLRRHAAVLQASVVFALFAAMAVLTFNYVWYWDNDVRLFTHATQLCGDSPNAYGYLAFVYINQGQTKKAEAIARTLIANPALRARGWYILGTVRFQEKDYEEARKAMQNGFQLSQGKDLLTIMGLAGTDLKLDRYEEAAQIYRDALKKFPNSAYLHGNLASALKGMGESDQAARELELQRRLQ